MLRWSVLLVVAAAPACGKHADRSPAPGSAAIADDLDPPCDPKTPKVCYRGDVVACEDTGKMGRALRACKNGCERGRCKGTCTDDASKLIYLVDDANDFLSFDPRKLPGDPFQLIGRLSCELGSPFSMSVDRSATAWVVYQDGDMFKVDINDAHCEPSGFAAGSTGALVFGMGFTTDAPGADTEKLYLANDDSSNALEAVDTVHDLRPKHLGTITAVTGPNPELTGGSDARLYGFFPETGNAFVQEIDPKSGRALGAKWHMGSLGDVNAYAFAEWGGIFYVFTTAFDDDFTSHATVRTLDPATGKVEVVVTNAPFRVTGAGVSTCAPERDAAQP